MIRITLRLRAVRWIFAAAVFLPGPPTLRAQPQKIVLTDQEKAIVEQMRKLRSLPDDERVKVTKRLAVEIRQLPLGSHKLGLADSLANLVTEGDPGLDTLQEVASTLADALREQPVTAAAAAGRDQSAMSYATLANSCATSMSRYRWTTRGSRRRWPGWRTTTAAGRARTSRSRTSRGSAGT